MGRLHSLPPHPSNPHQITSPILGDTIDLAVAIRLQRQIMVSYNTDINQLWSPLALLLGLLLLVANTKVGWTMPPAHAPPKAVSIPRGRGRGERAVNRRVGRGSTGAGTGRLDRLEEDDPMLEDGGYGSMDQARSTTDIEEGEVSEPEDAEQVHDDGEEYEEERMTIGRMNGRERVMGTIRAIHPLNRLILSVQDLSQAR